ncbi:hypothetical protein BTUL_0034g00260 [Botrytis tulipae]|uniref:BTB domain-containing protein n=1 Tax=Botrytis tulipae TaxID=87230 RepID=A0A4Z1EU11_9HELO|nr:hypothetical protein BTUL_0034g00260 [Botrytis tulipae]
MDLILNSRLFKFFVHEEAIVQLSRPLEALMRGGMSESQAGCTVWDDVSKETFEQFVQFAYTGDYTVPVPTKNGGETKGEKLGWAGSDRTPYRTTITRSTTGASGTGTGTSITVRTTRTGTILGSRIFKYPDRTSHLRESDFNKLVFPLLALRNNYELTCEPREWHNPCQGYSNVLISHAALYILGDFRLIDSLKALALYKLHKTLSVFRLSTDNLQGVIDLVRYIYAEEGGEERSDGEIEALRGLVCLYLAINAWMVPLDDRFMELLGEGGQFVKDFFMFKL